MKSPMTLFSLAAVLLLAACGEPTMDASTPETRRASIPALAESAGVSESELRAAVERLYEEAVTQFRNSAPQNLSGSDFRALRTRPWPIT